MKRLALFAVPALALGLGAGPIGCTSSVNGEVDGKAVDALFSALFTEDEDDFGADDTLTSVNGGAMSVLDGCNGAAKRQQNLNVLQDDLNKDLEDATDEDEIKDAMEKFATGVVEYDEKNLPTDFWTVGITAQSVDDGAIDGGSFSFKYDDEEPIDLAEDVGGGVTVCRINDHPSVGENDQDFPIVEADADCWAAIEADIEIVKWEPEATFNAKATVTLGDFEDFLAGDDDEPKDVGEVEINISAGHCPQLQEAEEEAEEIAEDALPG